ncbi:MAG: hypothetical protein PHN84_00220 [Desulfuromonadaceae bacterium]|nr:hypothetical protein [Desulfuromonadaceae bacterium]MDD2855364.1 hypothetical protein [Desulfuromonadaceae bacterium]
MHKLLIKKLWRILILPSMLLHLQFATALNHNRIDNSIYNQRDRLHHLYGKQPILTKVTASKGRPHANLDHISLLQKPLTPIVSGKDTRVHLTPATAWQYQPGGSCPARASPT